MKPKLRTLWFEFVRRVAWLSTDKMKVGCALVTKDGERLLSFGYNGTWRGQPNVPVGDTPGDQRWIHAEANALIKVRSQEPFVAFITHTPCIPCAGLLFNSGCHAVYALEESRDPAGWDQLKRAGMFTSLGEQGIMGRELFWNNKYVAICGRCHATTSALFEPYTDDEVVRSGLWAHGSSPVCQGCLYEMKMMVSSKKEETK